MAGVTAAKWAGNKCHADQQLPKPVPLNCPKREAEARFLFDLSVGEVRIHSKRTRIIIKPQGRQRQLRVIVA